MKICGITCTADAKLAVDAGADAIGMIAHDKAARAITQEEALEIASSLPERTRAVLLFVDDPEDIVASWHKLLPQAVLQFHGNEAADSCASFGAPYIKALRPGLRGDVLAGMDEYADALMLLLDGGHGSGKSFDWSLMPAPGQRTLPVGLAGGLTPRNVAQAVAETSPDWIDVSSGVCAKGDKRRKDPAALAAFAQAARQVAANG